MNITVCIGSGCHVKGSRKIIAQLQQLIAEENLACDLELEQDNQYRKQDGKIF